MRQPATLFLTIFLLGGGILTAQAQTTLKRDKVGKFISIEVPETFVAMSKSELISKYVSSRKPLAMYTSQDRLIDLGINENSSRWTENDLEILMSFYKASIANLFTKVDFHQEEIKEIAGRKFIVFEFTSKVTSEDNTFGGSSAISKYTYIQYTLRNDKVLLFNFSCPLRIKNQWQETAHQIMNSVRIKS